VSAVAFDWTYAEGQYDGDVSVRPAAPAAASEERGVGPVTTSSASSANKSSAAVNARPVQPEGGASCEPDACAGATAGPSASPGLSACAESSAGFGAAAGGAGGEGVGSATPSVLAEGWASAPEPADAGSHAHARLSGAACPAPQHRADGQPSPAQQRLHVRVVATPTVRPLPLPLLTRRDPFLLFRSLTLYADDLHDRGQAEVTVKVRVMPSCFLVLLRTYLRIDHERVALRDVRYCGVFEEGAGAGGAEGAQPQQSTHHGDEAVAASVPAASPAVAAAAIGGGEGGGGIAAAYPRHLQGGCSVPTDGAAAAAAAPGGAASVGGVSGGEVAAEALSRGPLAVCLLKNVQLRRADAATVRQVRERQTLLRRPATAGFTR